MSKKTRAVLLFLLGLDAGAAAGFTQADFEALPLEQRASLTARVQTEIKENRYNAATGALAFTPFQAEAYQYLVGYYTTLFKEGNERMALQPGIVNAPEEGRRVTAFFAWLAWAAGALRPDGDHTYTANWPFDPLVGNHPMPDFLIWSIVSVILLLFLVRAIWLSRKAEG